MIALLRNYIQKECTKLVINIIVGSVYKHENLSTNLAIMDIKGNSPDSFSMCSYYMQRPRHAVIPVEQQIINLLRTRLMILVIKPTLA